MKIKAIKGTIATVLAGVMTIASPLTLHAQEVYPETPYGYIYSIVNNAETDMQQVPVYDDDFGILLPPDPNYTDEQDSIPGDAGNDMISADMSEDDTANITHYAVKYDCKVNTSRNPAGSFFASTPSVVTFVDGSGHINVAYPSGNKVKVQIYDSSSGRELSGLSLEMPYSLFGNVICDESGNYYLTCGQNGSEDEITMCICKYDQSGNKSGELDLTGGETVPYSGSEWGTNHPFDAGSCDMAINHGVLAVNYGRQMYNGHQSNMMIYVDTSDMHRIYANTAYTSHSFDQRVYAVSDGSFIALNHGDAYNRGFHITKISELNDSLGFWLPADDDFYNFHFREGASRSYGYNETFAQLGGLAELENAYVFAGASERTLSLEEAPSSGYLGHNEARDLFVQILKGNFWEENDVSQKYTVAGEIRVPTGTKPSSASTELWLSGNEADYGVIWLTDYDNGHYAANPKVFKVRNNLFGLLWEKRSYSGSGAEVYFMVMKTDGTIVKEPIKVTGCLLASNTAPVVYADNIWWASSDNNGSYLNSLSPSDIKIKKQPYASEVISNNDGSFDVTFTIEASGAESCIWQSSVDGISWNNVSDGYVYSVRGLKENIFYRCILTDALDYHVTSETAAGLLSEPADVEAALDENIQLKVSGYGIATYEWQESSNGKSWTPITSEDVTGQNSSAVIIPMTTEQRFTNKYRCEMSGLSGTEIIAGPISVTKKLTVIKQPQSRSGEKGETLTTSVEGWGEGVTYQWYERTSREEEWKKASFKGNNTNTLSVIASDSTLDREYKCVLKDKYAKTVDSDVIILAEGDSVRFVKHSITMVSKPGSTKKAEIKITGGLYSEDSLIWNSSDPSIVSVSGGVLSAADGLEESKSVEISFITTDKSISDVCTVTVNPMPRVMTPCASIDSSEVLRGTGCLLNTGTENTSILYTTDNSKPAIDSEGRLSGTTKLYEEAIIIDHDMTLRAIAVKEGYKDSPETVCEYTICTDWGDITGEKMRAALGSIENVPDDVWFIFGNETDGYTPVYTASSATTYSKELTKNGVTLQGDIHVYHGTAALWENRDYNVSYKNNKAAAGAGDNKPPTVILKGKGRYTKSSEFKFTIVKSDDEENAGKIPASKVKVACLNTVTAYTGAPITIEQLYKPDKTGFSEVSLYTIVNREKVKLDASDYDISFANTGSTGKQVLTFVLKGDYTGRISKTVTVKPYDIGKDPGKMLSLSCIDTVFDKAGAIPDLTVKFGGKTLTEGVDYRLSYKNNKKTGLKGSKSSPSVLITGTGNFTGKVTETFSIEKADLNELELTVNDIAYMAQKGNFISIPKITDDGVPVTVGKNKDVEPVLKSDYQFFDAGTGEELDTSTQVTAGMVVEVRATVTSMGTGSYKTGTEQISGYYCVIPADRDLKKATVKIKDPARITYQNGRAIVPLKSEDLVVTLGKTVIDPKDYEIVSLKKNILPGTATITIRGKGQYGGKKTSGFKIGAKFFKGI